MWCERWKDVRRSVSVVRFRAWSTEWQLVPPIPPWEIWCPTMTGDAFGKAYVRAAVAHGAAIDRGDSKKANAAHAKLMYALEKIRAASDRGLSVLTVLLVHEDPSVRCWAATHTLPLDEKAAITTLTQLTSEPSMVGFGAEMVLEEWKAGRLNVP